MAGSILLHIKDYSEQVSLVLDVPSEFSASQVLLEVIEAINLKCVDNQGQPLRYVLQRQRDNMILPPHGSLSRFHILYGETLYLTRAVTAAEASGVPAPAAPPYAYPEIYRLQAAGCHERALLALLERWENFDRLANIAEDGLVNVGLENTIATKEALLPGIEALFHKLVDEQLKSTDFDEFYNLLEADATRHFFEVYPAYLQRFTAMMLNGSYRLAQAFKYQAARDFAVLAVRLDPENEAAQTLESLAQQYVTLLATTDKEERLDLARAIYQADNHYGNIAEDLRLIIQSNRLNRPAYPGMEAPVNEKVPAYSPAQTGRPIMPPPGVR